MLARRVCSMAGFWFFVVPTLLRVPNNSPKVDRFHCPVLPKPVEYFSPPATFGKHPHGGLETSRISHQEDLQLSNLLSKKMYGQWVSEEMNKCLGSSFKGCEATRSIQKWWDLFCSMLKYSKTSWIFCHTKRKKDTRLAPSILKINLNDLSLSSFFLVFCYHLPPPTVNNQQKSTTLHVPNS